MHVFFAYFCMMVAISASNYLVLFPINDWLTWGAFPYPVTFLVTELTLLYWGVRTAKNVIWVGFILAAFFSFWLATPQIAYGSLSAFLVAQYLDIFCFSKMRSWSWWYAPLIASIFASAVDTAIFWNIAFLGQDVPLFTWALGDFSVKLLMDVGLLFPYRFMIRKVQLLAS